MNPIHIVTGNPVSASSALSTEMFGANYVYDYERIGDLPWERFDELVDQLGVTQLRYPGGNAIETTFNYLAPDSGQDLAGRPVMGLSDFIAFAGTRGIDPTLILPNRPFLPGESHDAMTWNPQTELWEIDPGAVAAARALIDSLVGTAVTAARAAGVDIAAIELGNEYQGVDWVTSTGVATKMTAAQYGVLADAMAQWVQDALTTHSATGDPQVLVQVWGDFNNDGNNPEYLAAANLNALAGFTPEGLAAIDGTVSHIYFREGKTTADGLNVHDYATLDDRIAELASLSQVWSQAAGRGLSLHVSEWNVQKFAIEEPGRSYWQVNESWTVSDAWAETANFGLKQLAPMLEMMQGFNMQGVDSAQVWSVMYNAAALGLQDNGGTLTAPGALFALMADILPGTRALEVGVDPAQADLHAFRDDTHTHVFVSSRSAVAGDVTVDLAALSPDVASLEVTYIRSDTSTSDGMFRADGNTYITGDRTWLEADLGVTLQTAPATTAQETVALSLGAYEVALVSFVNAPWNTITGTAAGDTLHGAGLADRLRGLDGADHLVGGDGDDWLQGGAGDDALYGGAGADRLEGGAGDDYIQGGVGAYRDVIEGGAGNDRVLGGGGDDYIRGGDGDDWLSGDAGNDAIYGGRGADRIEGGAGDDYLHGGEGAYRDTMFGGDGDDVIFGGAGKDVINGNRGNDILHGEDGRDSLSGGKGRDTLHGGNADDILRGQSGRDTLHGGPGDDVLRGDGGKDFLFGGIGADRFVYRIDRNEGHDRIMDFEPGIDFVEFRGDPTAALDRLEFTQIGNTAIVSWDVSSIRFIDVPLDALEMDDFLFQ